MTDLIRCRAKVSDSCYDGRPAAGIYDDGQQEDGTWDAETDTIVCDPCYIKAGQPGLPFPASRQDVVTHINNVLGIGEDGQA